MHCTISVSVAKGELEACDLFLSRQPTSLFFHQVTWANVVEEIYGHRSYYLCAQREDSIVGVLPLSLFAGRLGVRCLISICQADYAGVCAIDNEVREELLLAAQYLAVEIGAQYVELRHLGNGVEGLTTNDTRVAPVLKLATDEESMWTAFPKQIRRHVRQAEKSGISVEVEGKDSVRHFYAAFCESMHRFGSPTQSRRLFEMVLERFPETAVLLIVRRQGVPIGGGICLFHRDIVEVPWQACKMSYFSESPNNAFFWAAIRLAISRGCRHLHFGSSPVGSGPYNFKMQWGAEAVPLRFQYLKNTSLPPLGDRQERLSYRVFRTVWRRLPLAVTNRLGPVIMKQLPL